MKSRHQSGEMQNTLKETRIASRPLRLDSMLIKDINISKGKMFQSGRGEGEKAFNRPRSLRKRRISEAYARGVHLSGK